MSWCDNDLGGHHWGVREDGLVHRGDLCTCPEEHAMPFPAEDMRPADGNWICQDDLEDR